MGFVINIGFGNEELIDFEKQHFFGVEEKKNPDYSKVKKCLKRKYRLPNLSCG